MTRAPYSLPKNPQPFGPPGSVTAWDTSLGWRYPNARMVDMSPLETMGETAENIYERAREGAIEGGPIPREEQDRFALQSHARAVAAIDAGVASGAAGVDPRVMGLGPIDAAKKALGRAGLRIADIDLVELNEAFAVQAIAVLRALGLSEAITNVNGGAIALGHPLGCSGARVLTTLIHEMRRRAGHGQRIR